MNELEKAELKEAAEKYIDAFRNQCNSQGDVHLYHKREAGRRRQRFEKLSTPSTILALIAEGEALWEALKPSAETKAAYIGEFSFNIEEYDSENDVETTQKVQVPWTVIKEIMEAIHARATLGGSNDV